MHLYSARGNIQSEEVGAHLNIAYSICSARVNVHLGMHLKPVRVNIHLTLGVHLNIAYSICSGGVIKQLGLLLNLNSAKHNIHLSFVV